MRLLSQVGPTNIAILMMSSAGPWMGNVLPAGSARWRLYLASRKVETRGPEGGQITWLEAICLVHQCSVETRIFFKMIL